MNDENETELENAPAEPSEAGSVQRMDGPQCVPLEVKLRSAEGGAMEITVDGWVYVRINYDYRYTDNARRTWLAREIFKLLRPIVEAQRQSPAPETP